MNKKLFIFLLLLTTYSFAAEDVCCIFSSKSGDSVQTFARIVSSSDCKGSFQGKSVCAAVPDPENTYCSSESSAKERCTSKCGFFWSGKECLTQDPKEKAKKELEDEAKKKAEADKAKGDATDKPATVKPVQPTTPTPTAKPADPDNPKVNNAIPEDDSLFNRKDKGRKSGMDNSDTN
jgi:hypothetical protein